MSAGGVQTTWVDRVLDLIIGCHMCGPGCFHCYGRQQLINKGFDPNEIRRSSILEWLRVDTFRKGDLVMLCPGSDVFLPEVEERGWLKDILDIVARHPDLIFLALTKRLHNAKRWLPRIPFPNLWLGTSVENQESVDERIPVLYSIPAAGYIISAQPLLKLIDLQRYLYHPKLKKVVAGCEMGPDARGYDNAWHEVIQEQCEEARVKFFLTRYRGEDGRLIVSPTYNDRPSHEPARSNYRTCNRATVNGG